MENRDAPMLSKPGRRDHRHHRAHWGRRVSLDRHCLREIKESPMRNVKPSGCLAPSKERGNSIVTHWEDTIFMGFLDKLWPAHRGEEDAADNAAKQMLKNPMKSPCKSAEKPILASFYQSLHRLPGPLHRNTMQNLRMPGGGKCEASERSSYSIDWQRFHGLSWLSMRGLVRALKNPGHEAKESKAKPRPNVAV